MKKILVVFVVCLFFSSRLSASESASPTESSVSPVSAEEQLSAALLEHLTCFPFELLTVEKQKVSVINKDLCLATIYHETGMKPLWVTSDGITERAEIILDFLAAAGLDGLDPDDYEVSALQKMRHGVEPTELAEFDTRLTFNVVKYVHDLSFGRIHPFQADAELFPEAGDSGFSPLAAVEKLLSEQDVAGYLKSLPPKHKHYTALKAALARYREIDQRGGWPTISEGKILRQDMVSERVPVIRARLAAESDLEIVPESEPEVYDRTLVEAVRKFQFRYGLDVDGVIGKDTLGAMNVTSREAVEKIMLNMARWRWQGKDLGSRYLLINIAHFDLRLYDGENVELQMVVIVGQSQHQTPVFSDSIKYLDFNPFWNVTPNIAAKEDLPELRKDPYYLVKKNIRLFESWEPGARELDSTAIDWHKVTRGRMRGFHLRQDPGPWNALGKVKFVFPNTYDVYLHDTPTQDLFNRTRRIFSHGCIRISKPVQLAVALLRHGSKDWTLERVNEIIDAGKRKVISLPTPMPVHITYQTVWLDKDGEIHFNRDVYDRDKRLHEALFANGPVVK